MDNESFELRAEDMCKYFICQKDDWGFIAINHCTHPDNPENTEGNCRSNICPIAEDIHNE